MAVVATVIAVTDRSPSPSAATSTSSSTSTSSVVAGGTTSTTSPSKRAFGVGSITITILEPATTTLAARSLVTTVRYPSSGAPGGVNVPGATPLRADRPFPLIVFSQGFDVTPESYVRLLDAWASAGYVVADPAYPFTSPNSAGGVVRTDIVHHPTDLSYVITALLADSAKSGGTLAGLINPQAIGVIGHSDGGDVSLAEVANTCCRDARVKAAVILSGAELGWFKGTYFATPATPMLVVQGTNDWSYNPVPCSVNLYDQAPQPKYFLSMIGQTHFSAYLPAGPAFNVVVRVTTDFLNGYLKGSRSSLSAMTAAGSVRGLATITSQRTLPPIAGSCAGAPAG